MMKQITHIVLAILLVVATTGISVKKHYCMGMLKYTTLAVWAPPCCGSESEMPSDCCKDTFDHFQVAEDFQNISGVVLESPESFLPLYTEVSPQSKPAQNLAAAYQYYRPPLIVKDVPVLIQAFLI